MLSNLKIYRSSFLLVLITSAFGQAQQAPPPLPGARASREHHPRRQFQSGEEVGEGEVVRITASLVSVPVSVIDRQGKYVVDLQQPDFRIYEDGWSNRY